MKRASTHVNIIWSKDSRAPQIVHPSSPFHFLSFIFVLVGSLFWLASHMNTFIFIGSLDLQIFSALLFFTPLKLSHLYSDLVVPILLKFPGDQVFFQPQVYAREFGQKLLPFLHFLWPKGSGKVKLPLPLYHALTHQTNCSYSCSNNFFWERPILMVLRTARHLSKKESPCHCAPRKLPHS